MRQFPTSDPILATASLTTNRTLLGPKAARLSLPGGNAAPTIPATVMSLRGYWIPDRASAVQENRTLRLPRGEEKRSDGPD